MENNQKADRFQEEQHHTQPGSQQPAYSGDVTGDNNPFSPRSIPNEETEGQETSRNEHGNSATGDGEENAGIGFEGAASSETNPVNEDEEFSDEDTANPPLAAADASKGYNPDPQKVNIRLNNADLNNPITIDDSDELNQARESDLTD